MNIHLLIPKHKGDTETAEQLKHYSYETLKPIIPNLLEWLQDCNWPVAYPVSQFLTSICDDISVEIMEAFQQRDTIWNYWLLLHFGTITQDKLFREEIIRIAQNPTKQEINEELYTVAQEIIIIWETSAEE
jgi:hypothetical protein